MMAAEVAPGSGFVIWNFPGEPPDEVEYELTAGLETRLVRAPVNTAIEFDRHYSLRYRGVWCGEVGAWNDDPYHLQWDRP